MDEEGIVAQKRTVEYIKLENALCEYSQDSVEYHEILNVGQVEIGVAERQSESIVTLREVLNISLPATDVASTTFAIAAFLPHLAMSQDLNVSYQTGDQYGFRITTAEAVKYAGKAGVTAAIESATGVVTLAGAGPNFATSPLIGRGAVLVIGGAAYVIDSIDLTADGTAVAADGLKVRPKPDADVVAAQYKVVRPQLRVEFAAEVLRYGAATGQRAGAYASELVVLPTKHITPADWKIVI